MIHDPATGIPTCLMNPELRLNLGLGLPAGGNGNAALSIDFTTIAALDSRITFTRASSATRVNASGLIETVSSDVARFDYDPVTLAPLGLLIEPQRTNLLVRAEEFDSTLWTKISATISAGTAASPDGATTADSLVASAASSGHYIFQSITTSSGVTTASVFAKYSSNRWIALRLFDGTNSFFASFDLLNRGKGSISASTTSEIVSLANGWCRISVTATLAASAASNFVIALNNSDTASIETWTASGAETAYIWGAQAEAGPYASSYIPTAASQVTRAIDAPIISGTNFSAMFNALEGAFVIAHDFPADGNGLSVLSVDDGSAANSLDIYRSSSTRLSGYAIAGSVAQADIQSQDLTGTRKKSALAYKLNDYAFCVDGGTVGTDASATVPTGLTTLRIGHYRGPSASINGHVRSLAYYRRRVTNGELQTLTA